MPVVDLELLELEDASSAPLVTDAIALSGGHAGSVRRLDGSTGEVKWEYHDERFVAYPMRRGLIC
jgi:outer membrane protein assembly factor BamB